MATRRKIKGCLHEERAAQLLETRESADLPRYCGEAAVDIIAVHVLASKYDRTCVEILRSVVLARDTNT
jgi:hypothetical protein